MLKALASGGGLHEKGDLQEKRSICRRTQHPLEKARAAGETRKGEINVSLLIFLLEISLLL
jgi:hypothetical protein